MTVYIQGKLFFSEVLSSNAIQLNDVDTNRSKVGEKASQLSNRVLPIGPSHTPHYVKIQRLQPSLCFCLDTLLNLWKGTEPTYDSVKKEKHLLDTVVSSSVFLFFFESLNGLIS